MIEPLWLDIHINHIGSVIVVLLIYETHSYLLIVIFVKSVLTYIGYEKHNRPTRYMYFCYQAKYNVHIWKISQLIEKPVLRQQIESGHTKDTDNSSLVYYFSWWYPSSDMISFLYLYLCLFIYYRQNIVAYPWIISYGHRSSLMY